MRYIMPITSNPTDSFIVTVKMKSKGVIIVKNVFSDFLHLFKAHKWQGRYLSKQCTEYYY